MDLVYQYGKFRNENRSLLRKALDTSAGVGAPLIPELLEKVITNIQVRLRPELAIVYAKYDPQLIHSFNRLLTLPQAGGYMGDGAITPTASSTYQRATQNLKVVRRKGAVTNFLQDASKTYIDAAAAEMENCLISHVYDLTLGMVHGNKGADAYMFDGWDKFIATNRIQAPTVYGTVPTNLNFLDDMIDLNLEKQGAAHKKCILMSPQMQSKVSQLLTNVRLNQGVTEGLGKIDIDGGWHLQSYREIPIIPTSLTRPRIAVDTVTPGTSTTTGHIPDATHNYFQVSVVDINGESLASTEVDQSTSGGGNSIITLQFAAVANALLYKIYYGATVGSETLIKVVPARTYDGSGTVTQPTTGTPFTITLIVVTADSGASGSITTAMANDIPLTGSLSTGSFMENIYMIDLDPAQGMGKLVYTNTAGNRFNGLVSIEPLAKTDDNIPFMVKSYIALIDSFEATSSMIRGFKVK